MRMKLIAVLILLAWTTSAVPVGNAQRLTEVTLGYFPGVIDTYVLPLLAKTKGIFQKHGLDLRLATVGGGHLSVLAFLAGDVRFSTAPTVDTAVALQREGKDPLMVYNIVNQVTFDLIMRSEVVERLKLTPRMAFKTKAEALKGLTFGMTRPGGHDQRLVAYLLRSVGLDPDKDITFVQIGFGPELIAAMKAGRIDIVMREPPVSLILERQGVGVRVIRIIEGDGPPEFRKFAWKSVTVLRSWAEKNPDIVTAFSRALRETHAWAVDVDNRITALKLLKIYFPETDDETLKASFDLVLPTLTKGGRLSEDEIRNQVKVWRTSGALETSPDTREGGLWTNQYNR